MQLTKTTLAQIRILAHVARSAPARVTIDEVAVALNLARPTAVKLLNRLMHAGLLCGRPGRGGGIGLARAPVEIRLGETTDALERLNAKTTWRDAPSQRRADRLDVFLADAFAHFLAVLDKHTLADLLSDDQDVGLSTGLDGELLSRS